MVSSNFVPLSRTLCIFVILGPRHVKPWDMAGEGWWEGDGSIRWIPGQESWSLERRDGAMRGTVVGQDLLMNTWVTI